MYRQLRYRLKPNGQASFIGIALAGVLIMLVMGYLAFGFLFDRQQKLQAVVDAGNLNVARQAITLPAVELTDKNEILHFSGIADKQNNKYYINLGNVNRMWGQVMLVLLNVQTMNRLYGVSSLRNEHAQELYDMALSIAKRLTKLLTQESPELQTAFADSLNNNPGFLTNSAVVSKKWSTYGANEANPSNMYVDPGFYNAAKGFMNIDSSLKPAVGTGPISIMKKTYLSGYNMYSLPTGASAPPYQMLFVPLGHQEKPFSITPASLIFGALATKEPISYPDQFTPNAFSYLLTARDKANGQLLSATNIAVAKDTGPGYPISIPHGFVIIDNAPGWNSTPGSLSSGQNVLETDAYLEPSVDKDLANYKTDAWLGTTCPFAPDHITFLVPSGGNINFISGLEKTPHNQDFKGNPTLADISKNVSQFISKGSLHDFLLANNNDANNTNWQLRTPGYSLQLYQDLRALLQEIKPGASDDEIFSCLDDRNEFPMGSSAIIYKDDNDNLVVTILQTNNWGKLLAGPNPPAWLVDELNYCNQWLAPSVIDNSFTLMPSTDYDIIQPMSTDASFIYRVSQTNPNLLLANYNYSAFLFNSGYGGVLGKFTLFSVTVPMVINPDGSYGT